MIQDLEFDTRLCFVFADALVWDMPLDLMTHA